MAAVAGTRSTSQPGLIRFIIWFVEVTRITPNALTIIGFLAVVGVGGLIVLEWWWVAGFAYVISTLADSLDGTLARYQGTSSAFGAFLDSTLDRAADGVLFGAFAIVFAVRDQPEMVGVVIAGLVAALVTSYARAKAEGVGMSTGADAGLMERTERLILIGPAVFMGGLEYVPEAVFIALAVLSIYTAIVRVDSIRRGLANTGENQ